MWVAKFLYKHIKERIFLASVSAKEGEMSLTGDRLDKRGKERKFLRKIAKILSIPLRQPEAMSKQTETKKLAANWNYGILLTETQKVCTNQIAGPCKNIN